MAALRRALLSLAILLCASPLFAQATATEDSPTRSGELGVTVFAKRCDTAASSSGTDGDHTFLCTDSSGRLWVSVGNGSSTVTNDGDIPRGTASVAETAAVQYQDNGSTLVSVIADPCAVNTKQYASLNGTADATVITGTSAKKIYVCSFNIVTATAQNIDIHSGTGTTCQTGTTAIKGLSGGTTAATGWNFVANGGTVIGNGASAVAQVQNNADNLCVDISGSGQYSGGLTYVVQ